MAVVGEGAEVLHVNMCDSRFARAAHDSMFKRPGEKLRKYSDKVKTHCCPQFIVETFVLSGAFKAFIVVAVCRDGYDSLFPNHRSA